MESRTWPVNIFDMQIFALFVERALQTQTYRDRRKLQVVETKWGFIIILCNTMHTYKFVTMDFQQYFDFLNVKVFRAFGFQKCHT